jgi:ubiquinone/menaquinone biosynthesis C-methylase UbiE
VFREVYRVLKPGGRMIVSDIVLTGEIPEALKESVEGLIACLANASTLEEYLEDVRSAGLELDLVDAQGLPSVLKPETTDPLIRAVYESLPNAESMVGLAQSVKILASKPA